jgi:predicted GIY-YIG superfamily endonuclease
MVVKGKLTASVMLHCAIMTRSGVAAGSRPRPRGGAPASAAAATPPGKVRRAARGHHSVYVVYLRNPRGDGQAGYYVGMTGLSPEQRFKNHKAGIKAARVVRKHGERLVPKLYAHLNPMTYENAKAMEVMLADSLRKRGYQVYGGH